MSTALVVTPFGEPRQLAAACVLADIPGDVVPVGDFSALVLDSVEKGTQAAAAISKLAGKHEVLLLVHSDEQIDAGHYRHGEREADVPAGLALTNLPSITERLLLGTLDAKQAPGYIDTSKMSKVQASAATMTPQRAALARTALVWIITVALGLVVVVLGLFALAQTPWAWVVVVFGGAVSVIAASRVWALLWRRSAGASEGQA